MRLQIALVGSLSAIAGCASIDRYSESRLIPGADSDHWMFQTKALVSYPEADPKSEDVRLGWLTAWMKDANACPRGWNVTNRRAVPQKTGLGTTVHAIYYQVSCEAR